MAGIFALLNCEFEQSCTVGGDLCGEVLAGERVFFVLPHVPDTVVHTADGDVSDVEADLSFGIICVEQSHILTVFTGGGPDDLTLAVGFVPLELPCATGILQHVDQLPVLQQGEGELIVLPHFAAHHQR